MNAVSTIARPPSPMRQRLHGWLGWLADAIDFLGRTAWPLVDLAIRVWIGKLSLVASVLVATDFSMAVSMAPGAYPIPVQLPMASFFESWALWLAALSLIAGLATRLGAGVLGAFAIASQVGVEANDLNLFWIAALAAYVLVGAERLSLDRLLSQGLRTGPLPYAGPVIAMFDRTRRSLANAYVLGLRGWLTVTLAVAGGHLAGDAMGLSRLASWMPVTSATLLFGSASLALALLVGAGFATRLVAAFAIGMIGYREVMAQESSYPIYWIALFLLLLVKGPGPVSIDGLILAWLKSWLPELSGKPAFALDGLPRVVIVGAGFGGIACARALRHTPVSITVVDRQNHHLFQPLLYQVATASLSPADIAIPIRSVFRDQFNAKVLLADVTGVDTARREVLADGVTLPYDHLVIATGATHSYFGKDVWAPFAPGLKRLDDATHIRRRVLNTFERAEIATTEEERRHLLTFVVVGGGPTGVELAGAIAELARVGMEKDFRTFDPASAEVILVQAAPRVLPTFPEPLSEIARRSLEEIGVAVRLDSMVQSIDAEGVIVNGERIYSRTVLWAAGVAASPAARWLKADADPAGRVKVNADLTVPGLADVYVIGDTAAANCWEGRPVPGLAPAAKQGGLFAADAIRRKLAGDLEPCAFAYKHLGSLATIGRKSAIADFGKIQLHGGIAWWLWGLVHILFLVGLRNRLSVAMSWLWSYITYRPTTRLITGSSDAQP